MVYVCQVVWIRSSSQHMYVNTTCIYCLLHRGLWFCSIQEVAVVSICPLLGCCALPSALQLGSGILLVVHPLLTSRLKETKVSKGPPHMALQSVMSRNSTFEDAVRWARCLSEIMKQAGQLCSESAKAAYVEVSSRLQVSFLC